jgi:Zn-dependent protease with chaperone function
MSAAFALAASALVLAAPQSVSDRQLEAFEAKVIAELTVLAPAAVPDALAAGDAYRSRRWKEAIEGYGRVRAAAPRFSHALRRLCTAQAALGDRAAALPLCRAALEADPTSAANQSALATILTRGDPSFRPTPAEVSEARALAREALSSAPGDVSTAAIACQVALAAKDEQLLKDGSDRLSALAPGELATEYCALLGALVRNEFRNARQHLAAARTAGLDAGPANEFARVIDENEPAWSRWGPLAGLALVAWVAVLAALLLAGMVLSAVTLRSARKLATDGERAGQRGSGPLRRLYAAVLWLTCGVYYLSLPLVVLLVVGVSYGAWLAFGAIGRIPIKLAVLVLAMVVVSLWAVAKSLWASLVRAKAEDPGMRLSVVEHPRFKAALEQAASRVGTRPVDVVFLTPGTDAGVYEQGGLARQLTGRTERCLVLGVGLLDGMTQGQLKSVLAHEYGHFVNQDTAGGGFALAVRRSMLQMAAALAAGGAAAWYNPAWLFVTRFYNLFLRVSQGASRLQEILADRWAALAYGGKTFAAGLTHVVTRSVRFDKLADATLREVVEGGLPLKNLYQYAPATNVDEREIADEVGKALAAEPSPYDSHPRPADRIAWVGEVACAHGADLDAGAPAWSLFADRDALERRLTDVVRDDVAARHGVQIPAEVAPGSAAEAVLRSHQSDCVVYFGHADGYFLLFG